MNSQRNLVKMFNLKTDDGLKKLFEISPSSLEGLQKVSEKSKTLKKKRPTKKNKKRK